MHKTLLAVLGSIILVGAGCASSTVSVQPPTEAPRLPLPQVSTNEPGAPANPPDKETLTFADELGYTEPLAREKCTMPAGASMTAVSSPTRSEFYPGNPALKFTMEVPYSVDWSFLGKKLMPIQTMFDDVNYFFGTLSVNWQAGPQDTYCGFSREYRARAEKGTLGTLRALSSLTLGAYKAVTVAADSDDPSAKDKPVELVVQVGDLLVHLSPINEATKRMAGTIKR